jgi:predicted DCC family thiol-disulfide oxidoreductase YuxK
MNEIIYYDGKCEFCCKMIPFLRLEDSYKLIDLNKVDSLEALTGKISQIQLAQQIHLLTNKQIILRGGDVLRHILSKQSLLPSHCEIIINSKLGAHFTRLLYAFVSSNRSVFNYLIERITSSKNNKICKFLINTIASSLIINSYLYITKSPDIIFFLQCSIISFAIHLVLLIKPKEIKNQSSFGKLLCDTLVHISVLFFTIISLTSLMVADLQLSLTLILFLKFSNKIKSHYIYFVFKLVILVASIYLFPNSYLFRDIYMNIFLFWAIVSYLPRKKTKEQSNAITITFSEVFNRPNFLIKPIVLITTILLIKTLS